MMMICLTSSHACVATDKLIVKGTHRSVFNCEGLNVFFLRGLFFFFVNQIVIRGGSRATVLQGALGFRSA